MASLDAVLENVKAGFSELFLIILLPPIILESAINMDKKYFFDNIGSILVFAIFGTIMATVITALLCFPIGYLTVVRGFAY